MCMARESPAVVTKHPDSSFPGRLIPWHWGIIGPSSALSTPPQHPTASLLSQARIWAPQCELVERMYKPKEERTLFPKPPLMSPQSSPSHTCYAAIPKATKARRLAWGACRGEALSEWKKGQCSLFEWRGQRADGWCLVPRALAIEWQMIWVTRRRPSD